MAETNDRLIGRLAATLARLHAVEPTTLRLCEASRQMLHASGAAISLLAGDSMSVVAATDDLAVQLEDLQEVVGEGPRLDALNQGAVQVADFASGADARWPLMHEHGERLGFTGTAIVVPLRPKDHVIGVLTVHRPDAPSDDDLVTAGFLSVAVGTAALQDPDLGMGIDQHADVWASRAQIHQATGMIISQVRVRAEDALALLRGQAFANNTSLLHVAQQVVERQINFSDFTIEGD